MPHFSFQFLATCFVLCNPQHRHPRLLQQEAHPPVPCSLPCAPSLSFLVISTYTLVIFLTHAFSSWFFDFFDFTDLHLYNTPATQQYGHIQVYCFHLQNLKFAFLLNYIFLLSSKMKSLLITQVFSWET